MKKMRHKAKIWAITTLVIAGLMMTSAAGIQPFSKETVSVEKKTNENVPISEIAEAVKDPANLKRFQEVQEIQFVEGNTPGFQRQSKKLQVQ